MVFVTYSVQIDIILNKQKKQRSLAKESINSMSQVKHPDAKKHRDLSFIKSGIRIGACLGALTGSVVFLAIGLVVAEIVGVYEELV